MKRSVGSKKDEKTHYMYSNMPWDNFFFKNDQT